jgi:hypothetical protein
VNFSIEGPDTDMVFALIEGLKLEIRNLRKELRELRWTPGVSEAMDAHLQSQLEALGGTVQERGPKQRNVLFWDEDGYTRCGGCGHLWNGTPPLHGECTCGDDDPVA